MPTLMIVQGPDKGARYRTADGETMLLGRASTILPLTDFSVSRRHAEVKPSGSGWAIEDLKSANGTYINGKRLERPTRLKNGDQIRMGATMLVWDSAEERMLGSSAAATTISDLVDLDSAPTGPNSAIIGAVTSGDDSMILASPAAAEAVRSWRVLSALLDAVGAVFSPRQLVERVIDLIFEQVPADRAFILLKDPKTGQLATEAVRHAGGVQEKIRASRTIVEHVMKDHKGLLLSNAVGDARFKNSSAGGSMDGIGLQSVICVPLIAREAVLGAIYVDCAMGRHIYTEEQLRLVAAIGQMAGLAIENARLVNERVQTERLAAAGETVAALSHYIKNILQGMTGGSDVVEMGLRGQSLPTVDQGWDVVRRNLDKIYSLSMNMLAFAKRREPRLEPVQLNVLVQDVIKLVQRRADDKGVMLKSALGEPMPGAPMDEDGIHQVVLNIVANAIDAAPKSTGVVKVQTAYDAATESATVAVGDNGPGIPADVRERIFDAFYSTKGHGGTGLGLAVAKKIVDEHGGAIKVTSVPGEGTLIRVSLPASSAGAIDSAATHGPAPM